ncbi:MAG: triose-phosphate isomerase [Patescibacteria group bacterium]|nr:triose-phosphate isomerase [Patescibacteria group bacterium]
MSVMGKVIIIANWKMNPLSLTEAKRIFTDTKKTAQTLRNVQSVVCPPFIYVNELKSLVSGRRCLIGAQDVFFERNGAYTGEISAAMLAKAGIKYVIVGHSEKRTFGETDEVVNKKTLAALKEGLHVVLCVGERERDEHALYFDFIRRELEHALKGVPKNLTHKLLIAYEPIWAIGREAKSADTPAGTFETTLFIRKILAERYDKKMAMNMPILYGGSVNKKNAREFLVHGGVQGLLVGRASLTPAHFAEILKEADRP